MKPPTTFSVWDRRVPRVLFALTLASAGWLLAHEGHAPLPTQGVRVDLKKGELLLTKEAREALAVQTAEIANEVPPESVTAYVTLVPAWQKRGLVANRLAGRIVRLRAQPGQVVEAGEVLAEVESAELEILQLEIVSSQNQLKRSEELLQTMKGSPGVIAGRTLQDAELQVRQSRNELLVAKAKWAALDLSEPSGDSTGTRKQATKVTLPVRSPIRGTVVHADLSVGKVVERGEHLFEIVDTSEVWAKIGVLEKDLSRVKAGQGVSIRLGAFADEEFRTAIETVGVEIDPRTHQNYVWAKLSNRADAKHTVLPGMYGQARIYLDKPKEAKVIPVSALVDDGVDRFVLLETAKASGTSEFQKKSVEVIRRTREFAEVRSSELFSGDRVATQGSHELGGLFVPGVLKLTPEARRSIGLQTEPAVERVVEEVLDVPGQVDLPPESRSVASTPVAGNLTRLHAAPGQRIEQGQLVAEVVSLDFQNLQLETISENLALEMLEVQAKQLATLGGIVTQAQTIEFESKRLAAKARRESLLRRLELLGLMSEELARLLESQKPLAALPVRTVAPGIVLDFDKSLGQTLRADEPILTLHNPKRPWVQGFVAEGEVSRIRVGDAVRVRTVSHPEEVLQGKIARSAQTFGASHRTLSVWVALDEDAPFPLLHNQVANLSVTLGRKFPALAVPVSALSREGTDQFVFVETSEGAFERRAVRTGAGDDRFVPIVSGLTRGEKVAVKGVIELQTAYASVR